MKPLLEAYPGASEEISNTQPQIVPKSITQKPYDDPWQKGGFPRRRKASAVIPAMMAERRSGD
jgi:hypothetical protein